jgi:hypothetical protein
VSAAGDVNRDGIPDFVVGAPGGPQRPGYARVFSGKSSNYLWTFRGAFEQLGNAVSDMGDWNGDGYDDVLVASPTATRFGVYVLSGLHGKVLDAHHNFSSAVSGAGDMNQDGFADLIRGGWAKAGANDVGWVQVFAGNHVALTTAQSSLSVSAGGWQRFRLDARPVHGGKLYLLLGSLHGTRPGVTLGPVNLPVNHVIPPGNSGPDPWFVLTLSYPNSPMLVNTLSRLDPQGRQNAWLRVPAGLLPGQWVGRTLEHAYVVFGQSQFDFASNAVSVKLLK